MSTRFDSLEQTLEMFVENCRQLCVMASDFQPNLGGATSSQSTASGAQSLASGSGQAIVNQKLQTLVSGLSELDQMKNQYQDVKIPLELLDYVDQGRNPQLYTRDVMEGCLLKNKQTNGKIELYKKFRAHLLKELGEELPKEIVQYRTIRECHSVQAQQQQPAGQNLSVVKE